MFATASLPTRLGKCSPLHIVATSYHGIYLVPPLFRALRNLSLVVLVVDLRLFDKLLSLLNLAARAYIHALLKIQELAMFIKA
jgi:hypothetical protein